MHRLLTGVALSFGLGLAMLAPTARAAEPMPEPVVDNPSPEARAVLHYLYAVNGKRTLSGQMWVPWGHDEIKTVFDITGKYPAIRGQDFIHEKFNNDEVRLATEWWKAGGIPTIMWHWGAPTLGESFENSKGTIDINKCFVDGTPEHDAMWADLKRIADHLQTLRDAGVPVLWRPMHELDGNWFWWSKGGPELYKKLWITQFNYFTKERKLNNLIWVLCHCGNPKADWDPGKQYYDIAGPDTYGHGIMERMYREARKIHGDVIPIPYHECGTLPDPDDCFRSGVTWSWWMLWHTTYVDRHDKAALKHAYNHPLVITRDELPNFTKEFLNPPFPEIPVIKPAPSTQPAGQPAGGSTTRPARTPAGR